MDTLGPTISVLIIKVSRSVDIIKYHLEPQLSVWPYFQVSALTGSTVADFRITIVSYIAIHQLITIALKFLSILTGTILTDYLHCFSY